MRIRTSKHWSIARVLGPYRFEIPKKPKDYGHILLVACAFISITLNPLLFLTFGWWERLLKRWPALWRFR